MTPRVSSSAALHKPELLALSRIGHPLASSRLLRFDLILMILLGIECDPATLITELDTSIEASLFEDRFGIEPLPGIECLTGIGV